MAADGILVEEYNNTDGQLIAKNPYNNSCISKRLSQILPRNNRSHQQLATYEPNNTNSVGNTKSISILFN